MINEIDRYRTIVELLRTRKTRHKRFTDVKKPFLSWGIVLQIVAIAFLAACLFGGCKNSGLKRLERNDDFPNPPPFVREEPYAVQVGRNGSVNIYEIYWKGNALDHTNMVETDIDAIGLPKYLS